MAGDPQRLPRREEAPPSIPGYELLGFIGRGSSGAVYRARQLAVDREVAIKILHPHLANESRVVRRLQREARTTARLAHPHIVSAVDMGEADGRWWYAMEFVDGPSLAQRLRAEGRIREREALRLFIPLCEALEHLWEHGVVHRDIKPGNILIERAGGARLADLGLAVAEDDPSITGAGGTLGTPHYISPEQAVDPRQADVKSDIWSFGATLYHAVCGRPPFAGESAAEVLSGVLYSPIPDPEELEPGLSTRLALVLRKCLTRDPARRYQNPHELLLDLERVRERRAPRVQRRLLDPVSRRDRARQIAIGATAGLLAVVGGLVWVLPRLVREPASEETNGVVDTGPFAPLRDVEVRHRKDLSPPAELMGELIAMEERVPLWERLRFEELRREVEGDLHAAVNDVKRAVETEFDRELGAGDYRAAAHTLRDELDPRFVAGTGYLVADLERIGVSIGPWRAPLLLSLEGALEIAVSELEALLLDWRSRRLNEVDNALAEQDWDRALAALQVPDAETVLAQARFPITLPASEYRGFMEDLAVQFGLRAQRLRDEWRETDRALRAFVERRRTTLEEQLRDGPPRIPAEQLLRGDFERELFDRRLSREKMPAGLSRAGLEALEAAASDLAALEESLLEEDARVAFAETEELAEDALRRRDYERALGLWQDYTRRLAEAARFESSAARAELARRAEVREAEVNLLDDLMERASERVIALDGQSIELRWGSILYSGERVRAGIDPRHDGFTVDSISGVLSMADLPPQQLEIFAGLGGVEASELAPRDRLALAAFRLHEGRPADARAALTAGALPKTAPWPEVGAELFARIASELEQGQQRLGLRSAEARRLLDSLQDPEFRRHSPRVARARVSRLLDELSDLDIVRQRRPEILRIKAELDESAPQDARREFQRAFAPHELDVSPLGRVTLRYSFEDGRLGAWDAGEWLFDGLGFVLGPETPVRGWDQLAAERGMRLILKPPMVPDRMDLTVRFEALQGERPARVLWLTAGGFQVALTGTDLPGAAGGPRHLIGTEDGREFLERLLAGEGRQGRDLIVPGTPPRELRLVARRRSGRCELFLDGVLLQSSSGLRAPPSDARTLDVRSWGAVRVISVTLEAGR